MSHEKYGWAEYYQSAFEREKKKNAVLTEQLSDAEKKKQELDIRYRKITDSSVFRLLRPIRFLKKAGHLLLHGTPKFTSECGNGKLLLHYKNELQRQKDPYTQWINETEKVLWKKELQKCSVLSREDWKVLVFKYDELKGARSLSELSGVTFQEHEILLFAENPLHLEEGAADMAGRFFQTHSETALWYAQEDRMDQDGHRSSPWFKPIWSPDTLLGFFYFGSFFAIRSVRAEKILLTGSDLAKKNVYDLCLKITETSGQDDTAGMTDLILYHAGISADTSPEEENPVCLETTVSEDFSRISEFWGYEKEYLTIKKEAFARHGFASTEFQTGYPSVWTVSAASDKDCMVSVIIPSKDHPDMLERCIRTFLLKTEYQLLEFLIVDNGSSEKSRQLTEAFLNKLQKETNIAFRYLYMPMEFNFSRMCNSGAEKASGEYYLFLNDDMEVIQKDWLKIMLGQAVLPGCGAVGAKLWYPEQERIQHAGITNMRIGPSHKLVTFPEDRLYYFGHNCVPYDMIAVTAACLLVHRDCFWKVGGFEESMAVAYNDVDFCFKLIEHGYRNVQRNDAVLNHHESFSRGQDSDQQEKWERLLREKEVLYARHPELRSRDPYYSEYLNDHSPEYATGYQYPFEDRLCTQILSRKENRQELFAHRENALMLTLERAGLQRKNHTEEPEIVMTEGWCYALNKDNACYERWLILMKDKEEWFYQVPVSDRYRYDVEAILPMQKNVALSGFVIRIKKEEILSGMYQIGILYRNRLDGRESFQMSAMTMNIS